MNGLLILYGVLKSCLKVIDMKRQILEILGLAALIYGVLLGAYWFFIG